MQENAQIQEAYALQTLLLGDFYWTLLGEQRSRDISLDQLGEELVCQMVCDGLIEKFFYEC